MSKTNSNFSNLKSEYIFPIIERKLIELKQKLPGTEVLNLGIADIAIPLAPSIANAISSACVEMTTKPIGYGPAEGYSFLRNAIANSEYKNFDISADEIFVSDGINTDCVNLLDLFSEDAVVGVMDPTYPAYKQATILSGKKIVTIPCIENNGFIPIPPETHCDVVYLCSPNNPTGIAMNRDHLAAWIAYAKEHQAVLILDNAYVDFVTSANVPRSIFSLPGAHEVAIELRSFSKSAGFTGLRCSYAVLSRRLNRMLSGEMVSLHALWKKRQNIKFNGLAYPIQKGAEAVFAEQGMLETHAQLDTYKQAAATMKHGLEEMGHIVYGATDGPFIWWKVPEGFDSWGFFDYLLENCHLIAIPGKGFGEYGDGYIRLSAFLPLETVTKVIERVSACALR